MSCKNTLSTETADYTVVGNGAHGTDSDDVPRGDDLAFHELSSKDRLIMTNSRKDMTIFRNYLERTYGKVK